MVVVTEDGYEQLRTISREIDDIEALCRGEKVPTPPPTPAAWCPSHVLPLRGPGRPLAGRWWTGPRRTGITSSVFPARCTARAPPAGPAHHVHHSTPCDGMGRPSVAHRRWRRPSGRAARAQRLNCSRTTPWCAMACHRHQHTSATSTATNGDAAETLRPLAGDDGLSGGPGPGRAQPGGQGGGGAARLSRPSAANKILFSPNRFS